MSPSEIALPLLLMYDGDELSKLIVCWTINAVVAAPLYPFFIPAIGIPWAPFAVLVTAVIYDNNSFFSKKDFATAIVKGFIYSFISIFLWFHLIQRIRGRSFRRNTVQAAYIGSYIVWAIWYVGFFLINLFDPDDREVVRVPFLSVDVTLYLLATIVSLSTLAVSLVKLYRARWDPKLATPQLRDNPRFDILPASVYVMPFMWSNIWLSWMFVFFLDQWSRPFQSPEPTTSWIVSLFFVIVAASIIWMLWSPMKIVAHRTKRMIGKQTES